MGDAINVSAVTETSPVLLVLLMREGADSPAWGLRREDDQALLVIERRE